MAPAARVEPKWWTTQMDPTWLSSLFAVGQWKCQLPALPSRVAIDREQASSWLPSFLPQEASELIR
jgi:hypothetical protein